MNFYNEIDPYCCDWLENLIQERLIPKGVVDRRSIVDILPADLNGFTQCHFFAGLGGWPLALRRAAYPDTREIWTGSAPCQPFSTAGKQAGFADDRHLWPYWRYLIAVCRPPTILGEQVASRAGRVWLSGVRADMEALGNAVGAADLCAAGVSAPHIRQRLYWVGLANGDGSQTRDQAAAFNGHGRPAHPASRSDTSRVVNADGYHEHWWSGPVQVGRNGCEAEIERGGRKYRAQWRLKPGLSIVAAGIPNRVERLCAAGNSIVPQVAAAFIRAAVDY